jgi:hypothetical protein
MGVRTNERTDPVAKPNVTGSRVEQVLAAVLDWETARLDVREWAGEKGARS